LLYRNDSPESQRSSEFVQSYFGDVGVEVQLKGVSEDALYEIVGQGNFDMFEWGWGVEPDPNYMLSTFTCGSRSYEEDGTIYANLSDSFYCNPEYDELFEQQATETDFAERQVIVREMQQMLYDSGVYLVTYYANGLEAYRNDRFTGWVPQPAENGALIYQWGTWSYFTVAPVTAASNGDSPAASASPGAASGSSAAAVEPESGSISGLVVVLIAAGVIILILVVAVVMLRRKSTGDRE
jgi:peptide/nickel transport system substrate-binding protein